MLATFALGVFIDTLQGYNEQRDRDEKLKRLEEEVRYAVSGKLMEVAEIQSTGHQPRVNVTVLIDKTTENEPVHPLAPPKEHVSFQFRLQSVQISRESADFTEDPPFALGLNPFKETKTWRETRSSELTLPLDFIYAYVEYKMHMLWLEDAIENPFATAADVARLNRERFHLDVEFRQTMGYLGGVLAQGPPPPAFHPAPAAGVARPPSSSPPPLPPKKATPQGPPPKPAHVPSPSRDLRLPPKG